MDDHYDLGGSEQLRSIAESEQQAANDQRAARPTADLGEDGELIEAMNRAWRHFYNTVDNPPENLVRKLIRAVLSRSGPKG